MTGVQEKTESRPDLILVLGLGCRAVVGLMEQDLLHLAVLQVVQLPHGILGPQDEVHQDRIGTLALYKCMLGEKEEGGGKSRGGVCHFLSA